MISIAVPCYNEQDNVTHIIEQFNTVIEETKIDCEVLLVNNGSTDNSQKAFETALSRLKSGHPFKVVNIPVNQGYGYGILAGLAEASGDILAWTHADLQTDPGDVFTAYKKYLNNKHSKELIIKGKRKKRALTEAFFTFGMQVIAAVFLRTWLDDINAQPKLFSREFYKKHIEQEAPHDFSLDLYLLYQAKKHAEILSIPVYFKPRLHGEAKGGGSFKTRIKLIKRTLGYIIKLSSQIKT